MRHGSQLPGIVTFKKPKRMALDDAQLATLIMGDPFQIETGTTDSGHTGQTSLLRPGGMFAKKTGSDLFIPVSDINWANIDKGSVATLTSLIAGGATWASKVIKLFRNGVQVASVTLAAGDDTTSEVVTALMANKAFAANATASGIDGAVLVITDNLARGDALSVEMNLDTAWTTDIGTPSIAHSKGTVPDVRVIGEEVSMVDANATAIDGHSSWNFRAGFFKATQLIIGGTQAANLAAVPAWARAVMEAAGSKFTA